jgi:hypothetical protein
MQWQRQVSAPLPPITTSGLQWVRGSNVAKATGAGYDDGLQMVMVLLSVARW